jgi:hypothetical protein
MPDFDDAGPMTGDAAGRGFLLDDERSPGVRVLLGYLLSRAEAADFAVRRIRLATLDFTAAELSTVGQCRVLLGGLDAAAMADAAVAARLDPRRASSMAALRELIMSGRAAIRSAGTCRWVPDFAVFRGLPSDGPVATAACLSGWLGLDTRDDAGGTVLTTMIAGATAAAAATHRFESLWTEAYDVLPVVRHALDT